MPSMLTLGNSWDMESSMIASMLFEITSTRQQIDLLIQTHTTGFHHSLSFSLISRLASLFPLQPSYLIRLRPEDSTSQLTLIVPLLFEYILCWPRAILPYAGL